MNVDVISKDDLEIFRLRLLEDLKKIVRTKEENPLWLRSSQVRKLLGNISPGTLQNFRVMGVLHPQKIGGIYYYSYEELNKLLANGLKADNK